MCIVFTIHQFMRTLLIMFLFSLTSCWPLRAYKVSILKIRIAEPPGNFKYQSINTMVSTVSSIDTMEQ